jgi:hypothetical protein
VGTLNPNSKKKKKKKNELATAALRTFPTRAATPIVSPVGKAPAGKYYSRKLGTNIARQSAPSAYGVHSNKPLSVNRRSLCNSPICQFVWTVVRLFTEHPRRVSSTSLANAPLISMATDAASSLCKPHPHPPSMPHLPCEHHVLTLTYQFLVSLSSRCHIASSG